MSLFSALSSATAGLRTVQANVKLVSDNIARADDPTRTRHTTTQIVDGSGQVVMTEYRREVDKALRAQVEDLNARDGFSSTQAGYMQQLGDLMRTTNGKPQLNSYAETFQAAWKTLETSPENETAQYQLVQAADNFAREIQRVSKGVEEMQQSMTNDLRTSVDRVNQLLKDISSINDNIVSLKGYGSAANEVADKRDGLIRELSTYMSVRTVERPDGRLALFSPTGLALVDAEPAKLSFDGGNINLETGNHITPVSDSMQQGKIGALFSMLKDGSKASPATKAGAEPTAEIIRKLRSQLDAFAKEFVGETKPGQPTSFRDAYNGAKPLKEGEEPTLFFEGTDRFTIGVSANLLENRTKIKQSAISPVVAAMNSVGRNLTADGLKLEDTSYSGMASAITGGWMAAAKTVNDMSAQNKESKQILEERYHSKTGVNIDEEIANLQQLQTSYAASARVMQVASAMFDALEAVVR